MNGHVDRVLLSAFAILVLTLVVQNGFDAYLLSQQKTALTAQLESQRAAVSQGHKIREQLEAIAGKTAALAEGGNPNAQMIIQEFANAGINIHAPRAAGGG